jgi:hypothetical protein
VPQCRGERWGFQRTISYLQSQDCRLPRYPLRIQANLLFVVLSVGGTAADLAIINNLLICQMVIDMITKPGAHKNRGQGEPLTP